MPKPIAYKTGSIQPPNTARQSNILVGVGPANWGAGAANATFYNSLDSSYQYVIIRNSNPLAMWGTGDFTDASLLTIINGLPNTDGRSVFTGVTAAISWLLSSGTYSMLKNEQPYGGPITDNLVVSMNGPSTGKNLFNAGFNGGLSNFGNYGNNPPYQDNGFSQYDITNDPPYLGCKTKTAIRVGGIYVPTGWAMEVGKTYTFSFWIKVLFNSAANDGTIGWNNQFGSGETNSWQGGATLSSLGSGWTKYTQTFTLNAVRYYWYFTCYSPTDYRLRSQNGACIITEFQMEEGSTATNYTIPSVGSGISLKPINEGLLNTSSLSLANGANFRGNAFTLDGIDDYISIPNSTDYTSFTISMWVKINAYNASYTYLFDCPSAFFLRANSQAGASSNSSWLVCNHGGPDGGETGTVYTGSITNVLYTYNGTSNTSSFYINGIKTSGGVRPSNIKLSGNIQIGVGESYTNMDVYSLKIFNKVLSTTEVSNLYNSELPIYKPTEFPVNSGIVLYLDASNPNSYSGTGTDWNDLSGYGNNFTLVNNPTFNTGNGGYFQFDGVDDYSYLAVNSSISVGTSCSLEMVVKNDFSMRMGQGGGYWAYGFEGAGFSHTCGGNGNINPYFVGAGFHHYVFTWNQAQNNHSMFRDGVLVYSFTPTCGFTDGGGGYFVLGGAYNGNTNSFQSYGSPHIAMLRLYNRIITNTEVQQNFNSIKTQYGL
jgi:hypothetical protein